MVIYRELFYLNNMNHPSKFMSIIDFINKIK